MVDFKFNPTDKKNNSDIKIVDLLPAYLQTRENKKIFNATIQHLFEKEKSENISGYIGRKPKSFYSPESDLYITEKTKERNSYQLEPTIINKLDGENISSMMFYNDLIDYLKAHGANTDNHDRLLAQEFYSFSPHINHDKFVNFSNYYWIATGSPLIDVSLSFAQNSININDNLITVDNYNLETFTLVKFIGDEDESLNPTYTLSATEHHLINNAVYKINYVSGSDFRLMNENNEILTLTSVGKLDSYTLYPVTDCNSDYVGKSTGKLPNGLQLENGMRIKLHADKLSSLNEKQLIIEGVGDSIIISEDTFNDADLYANEPDYITIERKSNDTNPWSLRNRWFHKNLLLNSINSSTVIQASRPIIEFARNINLYNYGTYGRIDVDVVYDKGNIQDITGNTNTSIDNILLSDGYRILVINDNDQERTNRIFKVYGIENSGKISLSLETDGKNKYGQPELGEKVFVKYGEIYGNADYHYDGFNWVKSQARTTLNQAPLFCLYDDSGISLDDVVEYPNSSFKGSTLFEYVIDDSYIKDAVLGLQIKTNVFGKPFFRNTLETETYTYLSDYQTTNITGYYFFKHNNQYYNHWHKTKDLSKQYIEDTFVISKDTNRDPIIVKTVTINNLENFTKGIGIQGENDVFTSVNLEGLNGISSWAIRDRILVRNQTNAFQNGIYEYVSGTQTNATLIRPADYNSSATLTYEMTVKSKEGDSYKNHTFMMIQTDQLDWVSTPMIWTVQTQTSGLERSFIISQAPDKTYDYSVKSTTTKNLTGFVIGGNNSGLNDRFENINLADYFSDAVIIGDEFVIVNQTDKAQNGVYKYTSGNITSATLTRSVFKTSPIQLTDNFCVIISGKNNNTEERFVLSTTVKTINWVTTPIVFENIGVTNDNISVFLNGKKLTQFVDFTLLNKTLIKLSLDLEIAENDYLSVISYSSSTPKDSFAGVYHIPNNLQANIFNETVDEIQFSDIAPQFSSIIEHQNGITGNAIGNNNYNNLSCDYSLGINILQHSANLFKLMVTAADKNTDIFAAIDFAQSEYNRFYNKFFNKISELYTKDLVTTTALHTWVDRALSEINVGKTSSFPFYYDGVAGKKFIPPSPAFIGITPVYRPQRFIDYTAKTPVEVIRLHDGQLIQCFDSANEEPQKTQNITISSDTKTYSLQYDLVYSWEISVKIGDHTLVPEVDYTVHTGSVLPEITFTNFITPNTSITITWAASLLDNVVLYFENIVYTSISEKLRQNTSHDDTIVNFSYLQTKPGFFRKTQYSRQEWNDFLRLNYNKWVINNKISNDVLTSIYNELDENTWNYSNYKDINGDLVPGFWRGIFNYYYDTDRPHTHPWEMLGFSEKPYWWDKTYGTAPYTSENTPLWNDIENGTIVAGSRKGTYPYLARPGLSSYLPVDNNGLLRSITDIGLIANLENSFDVSLPFVFGDMGPIEYAWKNSPYYSFALLSAMLMSSPAKTIDYFWNSTAYEKIFINSDAEQFVNTSFNKTRSRNTAEIVFGENDSANSIIGIQQYISNYLISNGLTPTYLGNAIRNASINLAYRCAGFIDSSSIRAIADSFGIKNKNDLTNPAYAIIPSQTFQTAIYKSQPITTLYYSGLIITKTDTYYEVSGYNNDIQYFTYNKPLKNSPFSVVNVGGTDLSVNDWSEKTQYLIGTYVKYSSTYYRCIANHTSTTFFDTSKWQKQATLPKVGGLSVKQYEKYANINYKCYYNSRFYTIQDLADFIYGYDHYLKSSGWVFDSLLADSTTLDFKYMVTQVLLWIQTKNTTDVLIVSPLADKADVKLNFGFVDYVYTATKSLNLVDKLGFEIQKNNVHILRGDDSTSFKIVEESQQRIYGARVSVVTLEHAVVFENKTSFDDLIYSPLLNIRQERIRFSAVKASNWSGRLYAPGFIVDAKTITSNFDKSVNDISYYYDSDKLIPSSNRDLAAKKLFGFTEKQHLNNLLLDERDQFQLHQGVIKNKGTIGSLNKLLRNTYVTDSSNISFHEEWAVRLGKYGALESESYIDILLKQDDLRRNPQIVALSSENNDDTNDSIITIGPDDPRFVVKRFNNLTEKQFVTSFYKPSLPTSGYAIFSEATLTVPSYNELNTVIQTHLLTKTLSSSDRIWVAIDKNDAEWNVYRNDQLTTVASIQKNSNPLLGAVVTLNASSVLLEDSVIILTGSNGNDGVYVAKNTTGLTLELYDFITGAAITAPVETTFVTTSCKIFRLHSCRFKSVNKTIFGNKKNPVISTNKTLIINTVSISLLAGDTLSTVITKINSAAIPNITASNWFGFLKLSNSSSLASSMISLSPRCDKDLGIESTNPASSWTTDDLLYFDNDGTDKWTVKNITNTVIRNEQARVDISYIKNSMLINSVTEDKIADIMLNHPLQGYINNKADIEISYKSNKDPAKYNNETNDDNEIAWTNEKIGTVWWDTSRTRFIDYDMISDNYRNTYWGKIFPGTEIDIYEWVKSPVLPSAWENYITDGLGNGVFSTTSVPKNTDSYVVSEEYNSAKGAMVPVYYFWIKNNAFKIENTNRTMSCKTISDLIANVTGQGVIWLSPISETSLLIANSETFLTDTSLLQISFNDYKTDNKQHSHWVLLRENEEIKAPPEEIWNNMMNSLVSYVKLYDTKQGLIDAGLSEDLLNSYLFSGNIINKPNTEYYTAYLPIPDERLSDRQKYGNFIRPRQSWFKDIYSAREKLVKKINSLLINTNWIDLNSEWDNYFSVYSELSYEPNYRVESLAEMNSLLTAPGLSNDDTIFVEHDVTRNNRWSFWKFNNTLAEKFTLIEEQQFDTRSYWEYVDWYLSGYDATILTTPKLLTYDSIAARNSNIDDIQDKDFILVKNLGDGRWGVFQAQKTNSSVSWTLIAKQHATIQIKDTIYDYSSYNVTDRAFYIEESNHALYYILHGFYNNVSTVKDKNNVIVSMIKESMRQNINLDWAFKTSLITSVGLEEKLEQKYLFHADVSDNIFEYLNETKPFHSKFRGFIEKRTTSLDDCSVLLNDASDSTETFFVDAVSLYPDQAVIDSVVSMPETTFAEKNAKQLAMNEKFHVAERIATTTSYNPETVIPGSNYKGLIIDGINFANFSVLLGIKNGYDNSPYDHIIGYDSQQQDSMSLYDIMINGGNLTDSDITTANEFIIDGDKFIQPYLEENRPEQLALLKMPDSLNLSVYTKGISGDSSFGFDVFPYDYENDGMGGFDYLPEGLVHIEGRPQVISTIINGDGFSNNFILTSIPQANKAILVFKNGTLLRETSDYTVTWGSKHLTISFSSVLTLSDVVKIITYSVGGGSRIKNKSFENVQSSTTVFDMGVEIRSEYGIFATVNGVEASFTTLYAGDTSLTRNEIKITGAISNNSFVNIVIFTTPIFTRVNTEEVTLLSNQITLAAPSQPILPPFVNNLVYKNGKRLLPPYTRYFDILASNTQNKFIIDEKIYDSSFVTVWQDGALIDSSNYTVDVVTGTITTNYYPLKDSVIMIALNGSEEFHFLKTGNVYDKLILHTTAIAANSLSLVSYGTSLTINSNVISFVVPGNTGTISIDYGFSHNIIGSVTYDINSTINASGNLIINGESIAISSFDTLDSVKNRINNTIGSANAVIQGSTSASVLCIVNKEGHEGEDITVGGDALLLFGINTGTYINAVKQIKTILGNNFYITANNGYLKIIDVLGDNINITDTVFGFTTVYTNLGSKIKTISYNVNYPMGMRTEVYSGKNKTALPITANQTDSNVIFVTKNSNECLENQDYIITDSSIAYTDSKYDVASLLLAGCTEFTVAQFNSALSTSDTVIITTFNTLPTSDTVGLRIFKNINESWAFLRISDENSTTLKTIVRPTDKEIIVSDATVLTQPNIIANKPGVVFVGSERIVFWAVDTTVTGNHKLKQLLRGTNGTPMGITHYPNSELLVDYDDISNTFILDRHGFKNGDSIVFTINNTTLPTPIVTDKTYFVIVNDTNSFFITDNFADTYKESNGITIISTALANIKITVENFSVVRDAGDNQVIPLTELTWFYTPNGLTLDDSVLSAFLKDKPASNTFNG